MRLIQRLLLLSLLLLDNQVEVILPKVTNTIPVVRWSSYSRSTSSTSSSSSSFLSSLSSFKEEDCAGCAQNKVGLITVTDPILTELRVEYVKQQILKKLRLSKPPEISMPLSTLPKPLINGRVLELRPGAPLEPEKSVDSFYGKTDQIVVFPNEGQSLLIPLISIRIRIYCIRYFSPRYTFIPIRIPILKGEQRKKIREEREFSYLINQSFDKIRFESLYFSPIYLHLIDKSIWRKVTIYHRFNFISRIFDIEYTHSCLLHSFSLDQRMRGIRNVGE